MQANWIKGTQNLSTAFLLEAHFHHCSSLSLLKFLISTKYVLRLITLLTRPTSTFSLIPSPSYKSFCLVETTPISANHTNELHTFLSHCSCSLIFLFSFFFYTSRFDAISQKGFVQLMFYCI